MTFRPSTCPNCGGSLQFHDYRASANCMYCGTSIQAAAAGYINNWLKLADTAAAAGNFEEAHDYYKRVLEVDAGHAEGWYGKGLVVGSLSSPRQFRIHEMRTCFRAALEHAPEGGPRDEMRKRIVNATAGLCDRAYRASHQRVCERAEDDDVWGAHLDQSRAVINALEFAYKLDPASETVVAMIVEMSRHLREGVPYHALDHRGLSVTRRREVIGEYLAWLLQLEDFYAPKLRVMRPAQQQPPPPPAFVPRKTTGVQNSSILLGIGIFFMPYVFSWFTLRKGYSTPARALSFGWLGVLLLVNLLAPFVAPKPDTAGRSALAPTPAAVATPSATPALTSAEKLARAKQLGGGEDAEQLGSAAELLRTIPASDKEAKEARTLEAGLRKKAARVLAEQAVLGPAPENSAWDGSVRCVDRYLKSALNDYDSAEYLEWSKVTKTYVKGEPFWVVRLKLRAPNAFGAKIVKTPVFFIRRDSVVRVEGL